MTFEDLRRRYTVMPRAGLPEGEIERAIQTAYGELYAIVKASGERYGWNEAEQRWEPK